MPEPVVTGVIEPAAGVQSGDTEPAAGVQSGVAAPVVDITVQTPAAEENQVDGKAIEGLKAGLVEERRRRQTSEAQTQVLVNQLQAATSRQAPEPDTIGDQVLRELGLEGVEYLSAKDQVRFSNRLSQVNGHIAQESAFISSHADYSEVVGATDFTGRFVVAPALQRTLNNTPGLAETIQASPLGYQVAYSLAIKDPEYQKQLKAAPTAEITPSQSVADALKKADDASTTQQSISAVSGQGNIDRAAEIRNMTPTEFTAYKEKVKAS